MPELTLPQIREIAAHGGCRWAELAALCETALAAIAERDRLRAAIEVAEHSRDCKSTWYRNKSGRLCHRTYFVASDCDCWKSAVTRG